tara:strand:+ start:192 stop:395 length:204 start_codon:yes stop_codon:yes gene_type:complete
MSSQILTLEKTNLQELSWEEMYTLLSSGQGSNVTAEEVILEILRRMALVEQRQQRNKKFRKRRRKLK